MTPYVAFPYHFSILLLSLNPYHLTDYLNYHLICAPSLVPHDWGACDCCHGLPRLPNILLPISLLFPLLSMTLGCFAPCLHIPLWTVLAFSRDFHMLPYASTLFHGLPWPSFIF